MARIKEAQWIEVVSHLGRYELREARISPLPPDPIEAWIGAFAEPAIDRGARLGDGLLWLNPRSRREGSVSGTRLRVRPDGSR